MKYIVKTVAGILYMLATYFFLITFSIILFIWNLNFKCVKELWKNCNVFYINHVFSLERYRYNSMWDYVLDNKDYSHKSELFKKSYP